MIIFLNSPRKLKPVRGSIPEGLSLLVTLKPRAWQRGKMIANKFTQFNFIGDIYEPRYNGGNYEVYIACWKVKRSKLDIKLRFTKVNPTSQFYGDWYLSHKKAITRKKFNNNGMECYVIKWEHFQPLVITERIPHEIW